MKDGGPAFPNKQPYQFAGGEGFDYFPGMSLRDYFAAAAIQGMFASDTQEYHCLQDNFILRAKSAYAMADAMIKAREEMR